MSTPNVILNRPINSRTRGDSSKPWFTPLTNTSQIKSTRYRSLSPAQTCVSCGKLSNNDPISSSSVRSWLTGRSNSQVPVRAIRLVSPALERTGCPFRCDRVGPWPNSRVTASGSRSSPQTRKQSVARSGWPPNQTVSVGRVGGGFRGIEPRCVWGR